MLGIIAYHRHSDSRCEMKRLYVTPDFRGKKLGEQLIITLLEHAKTAGYYEGCYLYEKRAVSLPDLSLTIS